MGFVSHGSERRVGEDMEWVEGQYQQCAYGVKMLGGHREKESCANRRSVELCTALQGTESNYNLKNLSVIFYNVTQQHNL